MFRKDFPKRLTVVAIEELSWRLAFSRGVVFGLMLIAVVFACPSGLAGRTKFLRAFACGAGL